jgi:hypothetical protein
MRVPAYVLLYMLVKPVKDLLDAFVIGAVIVSLPSLQLKISISNHGSTVAGESAECRCGGDE